MDITKHKYANVVTVLAQPTEDDSRFVVVWRSGVNNQGKVKVHIEAHVADKKAVAELTAMQHIIEVLEVIGAIPPLKGLQLVFSVPAIRKVHANKSDKKHLYPYAYFLTTRFCAAAIDISEDDSWIKPRADNNVCELSVTGPIGEWVNIYRFGKVCITRHVIEQFCKRMNNIEPVEGWKQLNTIVNETELEQLGADVKSAEEVDIGAVAKLYHRKSKWCFVIARNPYGQPAIATAYTRFR